MSRWARLPRRPPRHRPGLAVAFTTLVAAAPAKAAEPVAIPTPRGSQAESVVVSPPQCKATSFELAPFLDSLRVELAGRGFFCCTVAPPGNETPAASMLEVRLEIVPCTADADRLHASARAPVDSRAVERVISLADVARTARPRALALAVAELVRWLEQGAEDTTTEAVVVQATAAPSSTAEPQSPARPLALALGVEAEARGLPTRDTMMWGGRARLVAHRRWLRVDLDLGASYARVPGELGVVSLRCASAGLGLGPRFATRTVIAHLGLRAELGRVWIRGKPALADVRAGSGSDLIANVGLRLSLEAPAQGKLRPSLTLESGGILRGVKANVDGQPVAGMTGYYVLVALGIAVSL
jgi:hypothetical protein